jgi:hypothetical protein
MAPIQARNMLFVRTKSSEGVLSYGVLLCGSFHLVSSQMRPIQEQSVLAGGWVSANPKTPARRAHRQICDFAILPGLLPSFKIIIQPNVPFASIRPFLREAQQATWQ